MCTEVGPACSDNVYVALVLVLIGSFARFDRCSRGRFVVFLLPAFRQYVLNHTPYQPHDRPGDDCHYEGDGDGHEQADHGAALSSPGMSGGGGTSSGCDTLAEALGSAI